MEEKFYVHYQGDNDYYYDTDSGKVSAVCFEGTQEECEAYIKKHQTIDEPARFNDNYLYVIIDRLIDDAAHLDVLYLGKEVTKVTTNNEAETITIYTDTGEYTYSYPVFLDQISRGSLTILED